MPAALTGLIDFMAQGRARAHVAGWIHSLGATAALALALMNLVLRMAESTEAVLPWGILLSVVTAAVLTVTCWCGGALLYGYRIGVMRSYEQLHPEPSQDRQQRHLFSGMVSAAPGSRVLFPSTSCGGLLMAAQHTQGEGQQPTHTHPAVTHTHDHYHVSHHHAGGMLMEWEHRTYWHTHEHNHADLTHSHDYDRSEEDEQHGKEAHVHDHTAPTRSHT